MRILITGAGGFVGSHLINDLERAGHEVGAVDRIPGTLEQRLPGRSWRGDLAVPGSIAAIVSTWRPDAVAHLAGWAHVGQSWQQPAEVFEANVVATIRVYTALAASSVARPRFLYISSADVYGSAPAPEDLPFTEASVARPESPYAASKFSAEIALAALRREFPAELLIVRPFNHIGPGQSPRFAIPSFARQVAEIATGQRKALRHGNLNPRRDFLDVRDVVRAYRLILEGGRDGDLYTISSGVSHSMREIVEKLFELAGIPPSLELDPTLVRGTDAPEMRGSAALLTKRLGWTPEIPFDTTLRDILEEARAEVRQGHA